jgi:hypothetical protein
MPPKNAKGKGKEILRSKETPREDQTGSELDGGSAAQDAGIESARDSPTKKALKRQAEIRQNHAAVRGYLLESCTLRVLENAAKELQTISIVRGRYSPSVFRQLLTLECVKLSKVLQLMAQS